ncbi:hypothetical protein N0V94_005843 [Neodidymelliopsis sp. IMI 364377]|nr:hypothetical protein N0V94_005843 [Neodidymelliopsis sp. IMI 364377]
MAQANQSESNSTFVPKQALAPTPQLYDELVGDSMTNLANITVNELALIEKDSVILDNGCGTGAGTAAIVESVSSDVLSTLSFKGIDNNAAFLEIHKQNTAENQWPAETIMADAQDLTSIISDSIITHIIGTAFLFVLGEDGIPAMKEMIRVLKKGGIGILNSWAYVPTLDPVRIASCVTRPQGTPEIRGGLDEWSKPEFLKSKIMEAGFAMENITTVQREVYCHTTELDHYANMLWSFIGGTTSMGWLESDETNWDQAIDILKSELLKTEGSELLKDGRVKLRFVANIAVATK